MTQARTFHASIVAAMLLLAGGPADIASANLVQNGNFTATTFGNTGCNNQFGANSGGSGATAWGGQKVTGWTGYSTINGGDGYELWFNSSTATTQSAITQWNGGVCGSGAEMLWGSGYTAPPGGYTNFVGLDGDPSLASALKQTINGLTVGKTYQLTFEWAVGQVQSRTGGITEQLQVTFGSQTQSTAVVASPSQAFTGWFYESMQFTAASASQVLNFLSVGTPSGGPPVALLAAVSLNEVPEPASFALLGAGIAAFGAWRSRRRAR